MNKKNIKNRLLAQFSSMKICVNLFLGLFLPLQLLAQNDCEDKSFQFTATSTASTCQSNGTITVSLGEGAEDFNEFHYQILNSAGGFSYPSQRSNVLVGIPAGRHLVTVSAQCKSNSEVKKFASLFVEVQGNYAVPEITTIARKVRPSFPDCATGRYVFTQAGGNGNFTYKIIEAPEGMSVPVEFTPRSEGSELIVPFDLPVGDYTLSVQDDCYEAIRNFSIAASTAMPRAERMANLQTYFWGTNSQRVACDSVIPRLYVHNPEEKGFDMDDYEFGISERGGEVEEGKWYPYYNHWGSDYYPLPVGKKVSDFYSPNELSIHVRHKRCKEHKYVWNHSVLSPYLYKNLTEHCDNYEQLLRAAGDALGCFPLRVELHERDTEGNFTLREEFSFESPEITEQRPQRKTVQLDYGKYYEYRIYDADNKLVRTEGQIRHRSFTLQEYNHSCQLGYLYATSGFAGCPLTQLEFSDAQTGKVIYIDTLRHRNADWRATPYVFEYERAYVVRVKDENGKVLLTQDIAAHPPVPMDYVFAFEYQPRFQATLHLC